MFVLVCSFRFGLVWFAHLLCNKKIGREVTKKVREREKARERTRFYDVDRFEKKNFALLRGGVYKETLAVGR